MPRPQGRCDIGAFQLVYLSFVQPPVNPDGSSVFIATRGVIPIKFNMTTDGMPVCTLPETATISVRKFAVSGGMVTVNGTDHTLSAGSGSLFRADRPNCQHFYNLAASTLGVGRYQVRIAIDRLLSGSATFTLQ